MESLASGTGLSPRTRFKTIYTIFPKFFPGTLSPDPCQRTLSSGLLPGGSAPLDPHKAHPHRGEPRKAGRFAPGRKFDVVFVSTRPNSWARPIFFILRHLPASSH